MGRVKVAKLVGGWTDGWVGGQVVVWVDVKSVLWIAYNNKKDWQVVACRSNKYIKDITFSSHTPNIYGNEDSNYRKRKLERKKENKGDTEIHKEKQKKGRNTQWKRERQIITQKKGFYQMFPTTIIQATFDSLGERRSLVVRLVGVGHEKEDRHTLSELMCWISLFYTVTYVLHYWFLFL
jgi:hypothetical protein